MIPLIGLGTFIGIELDRIENYSERMRLTEDTIFMALQIGYRHLDLAEAYGNLEGVAKALKRAFASPSEGGLGLKRSDLVLTIKSNKYGLENVERFIHELGCDYFDNYLLHHPYNYAFSSERVLKEVWGSMATLATYGKVKQIGVSNCSKPHIERLVALCQKYDLPLPSCNEIESNIFFPNHETINICKMYGIQVIAYSPLGYQLSTFCTSESEIAQDSPLLQIGKRIGATPAQIVLAYHMASGLSVIPKSKTPHRLQENLDALKFTEQLTEQDIQMIKDIPPFGTAVTETSQDAYSAGERLTWHVELPSIRTVIAHSAIYTDTTTTAEKEKIENVEDQSKLSTKL